MERGVGAYGFEVFSTRSEEKMGKSKFVNDPVHGFITIADGLASRVVASEEFQRLRRVRQLGLSDLVYPGATHTRFGHSLGAMHLMGEALRALRSKGFEVTEEAEESALAAILMHDLGHAPFSHTLEGAFGGLPGHEAIGLQLMERLNERWGGALDGAIAIVRNTHGVPFLHQLVSGQLDVDRMDYLRRDSFFTGVREGNVAVDRLIKMLTLHRGELALEVKGIYSIEHFLLARRVLYWQVYLHKTVVAADCMLRLAVARARELLRDGRPLSCSNALRQLLRQPDLAPGARADVSSLEAFLQIDDGDVHVALKAWVHSEDELLSELARSIVWRRLPRLQYVPQPVEEAHLEALRAEYHARHPKLGVDTVRRLIFGGVARNQAYDPHGEAIVLIDGNGQAYALPELSRILDERATLRADERYYICVPKE